MNKREVKNEDYKYVIRVTEKQMRTLSEACDLFSRAIIGQDFVFKDLMEEAWEKRCKEATGKMMDNDFEGGWSAMRADAEAISLQMKQRFWGLGAQSLNGIHHDATSDLLYDIHCVLRHQLWLDNPDPNKFRGVDSDTPLHVSNEPLCIVERINK